MNGVKGGKLELLVPHMLRSQMLRPAFVRLSLRLGAARQMPAWAKLQFTGHGVTPQELDATLSRITSLESWVDEWESLGRAHEQGGRDALTLGRPADAARRYLAASAAYNFAQYVVFIDMGRKRQLHESCVRAYALAAPHFATPAEPFVAPFRNRLIRGYLRRPAGPGPHPVCVVFNGTNAVKEELHWWADALVQRGIAAVTLDGPGLGETFHRITHVAEPRPTGVAIVNHIESLPDLDPESIAFLGLSLGGYMAIRMATYDKRVRCVAAVSPPFSADVYWNVTLYSMRKELAALYNMELEKMTAFVERITLAECIGELDRPLMVAGGGHDLITPAEEAHRIFESARCERELLFYPRAAHECFNVLGDLRPRMVGWLAKQLARAAGPASRPRRAGPSPHDAAFLAAEAVDPDFADALRGEMPGLEWRERREQQSIAARFAWPWAMERKVDVVERSARG